MESIVLSTINDILKLFAGGFVTSVTKAQIWLFLHLDQLILHGSRDPLTSTWFYGFFQKMELLSVALVLPILLIAIIGAVISGSSSYLIRLMTLYLPISLIGSGILLFLLEGFSSTIDAMSSWMLGTQSSSLSQFSGLFSALSPSGIASTSVPFIVVFVTGIISVLASLSLYFELLIRQAVLLILGSFLPFALLFVLLSSSRAVLFRYIEVLIGVLFSKLAVVVLICLGLQMVANTGSSSSFDVLVIGVSVLILASFSPFLIFKLIPIGHLDHQEQISHIARRSAVALAQRVSLAGSGALPVPTQEVPLASATEIPSYLRSKEDKR